MFKKLGVVTALSTALLFGGTFQQTVDASANEQQTQIPSYKIYYSINGNLDNMSKDQVNSILDKYLKNYNINLLNFDWNMNGNKEEKAPETEGNTEKPVKQEKPVQKEDKPNKEESNKEDTVKEEKPAKQEQAPVKEDKPVQKEEKPAKQPEAPVKQPAQPDKKEEQTNQTQSQQLSQFEQEVFELTNQEREKNGLAPLKVDVELSKVAREKSRDMAANNYFSHNSPTYGSPFDMMKQFGITYRAAGENIAKGQRTPEEVVNAWMNSEGHRANILSSKYTHIGIGYVEQGNHWTQQFIGK
ncbi:CAP domain-containing protein [Virgibacillus halodenitrificans]|uniref:CAP domain-containing protein n=1 Tax=Virgibacillus halodenitrificans TaxID=1482 RepID=UPI0024BF68AD|nr:CAP domain-containing protein [Virgibacillus halodenitrificans]WHX24978.1 CAP domain-containing protein [Virgibacillus halodenitrificans]